MPGIRIALLVAAAVMLLPAGVPLFGPSTVAVAASGPIPSGGSGLPWASGSYEPQQTPAGQRAFGTWRRAGSDVAMVFSGRSTWADIVQPSWILDTWKSAPQTLVISVSPFPVGQGYSLSACARGRYDARWRTFGSSVRAAGLDSRTVVRLGWEFNGSWVEWAARRPSTFVGCWKHVFKAAESQAPGLRWDWSVNRGVGDALADATRAWPGRAYVDIVGVSTYDGYPAVLGAAGWNKQYAGRGGLKFWADFARRKGKRLSVSEWGLYPGTAWAGHSGGDNPFYIRKMFGFFAAQRRIMAYETYFGDSDPAHASALTMNPRGGAEYRRQIAIARRR